MSESMAALLTGITLISTGVALIATCIAIAAANSARHNAKKLKTAQTSRRKPVVAPVTARAPRPAVVAPTHQVAS